MEKPRAVVPESRIARHIAFVRGHKVMLDQDLAVLYGVSTTRLNEQVRRNSVRFPSDFMFQLTSEEAENLRSQFATSSWLHSPWFFPFKWLGRAGRYLSTV